MLPYEERIRDALALCRDHVNRTGSANTAIESYMTGYLLVHTYAVLEQQAKELVADRLARIADIHGRSFSVSSWERVWRGLSVSELSGFLNRFSGACEAVFTSRVMKNNVHVAYGNILENRHLM